MINAYWFNTSIRLFLGGRLCWRTEDAAINKNALI
jgi:hypothetical protein